MLSLTSSAVGFRRWFWRGATWVVIIVVLAIATLTIQRGLTAELPQGKGPACTPSRNDARQRNAFLPCGRRHRVVRFLTAERLSPLRDQPE